ncbi:MAG: RNA methyltransferase [Ferruginibacter sp.]
MLSKSTIKYIQSLQHKKLRDEDGVFVAEGPKLVKELLEGKIFRCKAMYALESWLKIKNDLDALIGEEQLFSINEIELEKISQLSKPNAVVAVFEKKIVHTQFSLNNHITLVLDDIQDPGNLGTIIRIADWFGVKNMVCSKHTADMYNSKVVQSTMASLQNVNLFYTDLLPWVKNNHTIPVLVATLGGKNMKDIEHYKEAILIIGNESKGVSDELLKMATVAITIPRMGAAESLNAAVATGIILYELTK